MADLTILPTWAVNYLKENLTDHLHVVNALPVQEGRHKGSYLINTSQGAVLITKGLGGEPKHWLLPLPARHFSFICHQCMERIEFVDPEIPRTVYCTHCGARYVLALDGGKMVLRRDEVGKPVTQAKADEPVPEPVAEAPKPKVERFAVAAEAYVHDGYTLHKRENEKKGGGTTTFYFFAKNKPKSGQPCGLPDGHSVHINPRTKLPYLKRDDKPAAAEKSQCDAFTSDGKQCRLTADAGKKYCHIHHGYKPISKEEVYVRLDGKPRAGKAVDTLPGEGDRGKHENQCAALTADGTQCSNRSRQGSKYCGTHKGYLPSKGLKTTDTKPVGRKVKDTHPKVT